ncbi:hypothetical protein ACHAXA_005135 [Cyclostephanos tholiformis]|uniref:Uncharacterized protein n=1 Tax=Cyclostephanos tholiformis TaxID=382380 RepID=A0ABD3RXB4_9STRA
MMKAAILSILCVDAIAVAVAVAVAAKFSTENGGNEGMRYKDQIERALSGSGDMVSFDDAFWGYDQDRSSSVAWSDYSIIPKECLILKNKHVIAFEIYGKGNNQCAKKKEDTYIMDVGQFSRAYVAQKQIDYNLQGNKYGNPGSMDYLECTQVQYNDAYYYAKLGCSTQGGLKLYAYTDASCTVASNTNIGLYNDIKISFNTCQSCVSWPADGVDVNVDDQFESYHMYDSKLCGAAAEYKQNCGWGCMRTLKRGSSNTNHYAKRSWNGFEKFCLFFWTAVSESAASVWVVLKQRRTMTREDAIVEEAAMNGVGLKKRHVFPLVLGLVFFVLLAMFMVWKRMTWILLIGTNVALFMHFVYLRRKAKKAGQGGDGYIQDAGLEIS